MSIASKLIGIWAVKRTVNNSSPLFIQVLLGISAFSVIALFTALICLLIVVTIGWFTYTALTNNGMGSQGAILILTQCLIILLLTMLWVLQTYWRKIRVLTHKLSQNHSPITSKINSISDAFLNGYNTGRK